MESLQLACLLSCKPCPKLQKLSPSLDLKPLRQVGFGSLWRNQTKNGCLMAGSSVNIGGGGDGGGCGGSSTHEWSSAVENEKEDARGLPLGPERDVYGFHIGSNFIPPSGMGTDNEETGEPKAEVSRSKHENLGDGKNQLLDKQLKEIHVELRKNNEEIKMLRETVQNSLWNLLRITVLVDQNNFGVNAESSIKKVSQELLEKQKLEEQKLNSIDDVPNTHENETPIPVTPPKSTKQVITSVDPKTQEKETSSKQLSRSNQEINEGKEKVEMEKSGRKRKKPSETSGRQKKKPKLEKTVTNVDNLTRQN